ncbi:hypothetical protein EVAR_86595_1 [Eumeta japonica]|uniref:Uncharacterized protein n=1 Tax=Eumeta variegata TaxID=151549 RepID=A0A4C1W1S5_EUMVA|nr:hypothetical protein EVAR_86595_1 [Eumeta japonica]
MTALRHCHMYDLMNSTHRRPDAQTHVRGSSPLHSEPLYINLITSLAATLPASLRVSDRAAAAAPEPAPAPAAVCPHHARRARNRAELDQER